MGRGRPVPTLTTTPSGDPPRLLRSLRPTTRRVNRRLHPGDGAVAGWRRADAGQGSGASPGRVLPAFVAHGVGEPSAGWTNHADGSDHINESTTGRVKDRLSALSAAVASVPSTVRPWAGWWCAGVPCAEHLHAEDDRVQPAAQAAPDVGRRGPHISLTQVSAGRGSQLSTTRVGSTPSRHHLDDPAPGTSPTPRPPDRCPDRSRGGRVARTLVAVVPAHRRPAPARVRSWPAADARQRGPANRSQYPPRHHDARRGRRPPWSDRSPSDAARTGWLARHVDGRDRVTRPRRV